MYRVGLDVHSFEFVRDRNSAIASAKSVQEYFLPTSLPLRICGLFESGLVDRVVLARDGSVPVGRRDILSTDEDQTRLAGSLEIVEYVDHIELISVHGQRVHSGQEATTVQAYGTEEDGIDPIGP